MILSTRSPLWGSVENFGPLSEGDGEFGNTKVLHNNKKKNQMFYMNDLQIHSEKFTTMMLLDDCFIVELFMKYRVKMRL